MTERKISVSMLHVGDVIVEPPPGHRARYVRKIVKHRDGRATVHYTLNGAMLGQKTYEPGAEVTIR